MNTVSGLTAPEVQEALAKHDIKLDDLSLAVLNRGGVVLLDIGGKVTLSMWCSPGNFQDIMCKMPLNLPIIGVQMPE